MLEWHAVVGIAAGIVQITSLVPYIRSMLWGTTRPNIVSFGLWTFITSIALMAQLSVGASWSVILLVASVIGTSSITFLGAIGYGYKQYGRLDWICFCLAVAAIILWQITDQPLMALFLSLIADLAAAAPTIVKTYKDPHSENLIGWTLGVIASTLSVISTTKIDIANLLFPIYYIFVDGLVVLLAFFGQRSRRKN